MTAFFGRRRLANADKGRSIFVAGVRCLCWVLYQGGQGMTMDDRIESLKAKHSRLEHEIDEEVHRPLPDAIHVTELKREKLRIKEEILRMSR
jgi:hypothetical protein